MLAEPIKERPALERLEGGALAGEQRAVGLEVERQRVVGVPRRPDHADRQIADHHDVDPAQVVLRWHLQLGNVVIPKSATPAGVLVFNFGSEFVGRYQAIARQLRAAPARQAALGLAAVVVLALLKQYLAA